ncbi:MAG: MerR family transcriptional regulator [Halioglobus sp.]|nr:MerR family transcriptional regulator [Halioglobus sp.]
MTDATTNSEAGNTYRMSALVEAAGVSRDMVKYYLRAGLLPPAVKPRANLSLYSDTHLQLIALVRKCQEQTRLSLPDIAKIFQAANYETGTIELELLSDKYRVDNEARDNIIPLYGYQHDIGDLDIPAEFEGQLARFDLLDNAAHPDEDEQMIKGLLWAAHSVGVPLDFLQNVREKVAELADQEVKTLIAIKRPQLNFNEFVQNITEVDRIINRWMVAEKSRRMRTQFQRVIDNSERALSTLLDTVYKPSSAFQKRHKTAHLLTQLAQLAQKDPGSLCACDEVRLISLLLRDYDLIMQLAGSALKVDKNDSVAQACIALAEGMQGNANKAFRAARPLEASESRHPIVLQARLAALLLKAAQQGGVADSNELMKSAAELFLESSSDLTGAHPETILLLARANIAFPDFANSNFYAINALEDLLAQIDNEELYPNVPNIEDLQKVLTTVYRLYTLYYLGVLSRMAGRSEAAIEYLEGALQLDPASNFGENAYRELSQLGQ